MHVEERDPTCTINNNNNDMNPWSLIIDIYKYIHNDRFMWCVYTYMYGTMAILVFVISGCSELSEYVLYTIVSS